MASKLEVGAGLPSWFRWLPRGFLLAAGLLPIFCLSFYYLVLVLIGPRYWNWELFIIVPFLLLIAFFAWKMPIAGGITAIVVIHLGVFYFGLMSFAMEHNFFNGLLAGMLYLSPEYFLMVTGGILSIIWGIMCKRRAKHGQA
jgi:hypothetical protein